uniref:NodB homology domain-containing protein n=1 Tax=Octopus bimaculoides TaxID=37653 RepID=A0A0L8FTW1_OCTBM
MKLLISKQPLALLIVITLLSISNGQDDCNSLNCVLPNCNCKSSNIPHGLSKDVVPQLVMITFDDAVTIDNYETYSHLMTGITNPNGCPISATFFVSHEYTNYKTVQQLHSQGHEIASHSISHRFPPSWWETANYTDWYSEIQGQREMLSTWAHIDKSEIKGMRAPFLQPGGNWQFQIISDLKRDGFKYDASLVSYIHKIDPYAPPIWPYTLDFPSVDDCGVKPCPDWTFRGLWEIPLVEYEDKDGTLCAMLDECDTSRSEEELYNVIMKNFENHYNTNRAPFGIYMHSPWLKNPSNFNVVRRFMQDISTRGDVWFVSQSKVLDWIQNPKTLQSMDTFSPFNCWLHHSPWVCTDDQSITCVYDTAGFLVWPKRISKRNAVFPKNNISTVLDQEYFNRQHARATRKMKLWSQSTGLNFPGRTTETLYNDATPSYDYGESYGVYYNGQNEPGFIPYLKPNEDANHQEGYYSEDSGTPEREAGDAKLTSNLLASILGPKNMARIGVSRKKRQSNTFHELHICSEYCPFRYPWLNNIDGQ